MNKFSAMDGPIEYGNISSMTNKQFVWNFSLALETANALNQIDLESLVRDEQIKWETRYFWPSDTTIPIQGLSYEHLKLDNYRFKKRQDSYILVPPEYPNLKIRKQKLHYKPLLASEGLLLGYGKKQKIPLKDPQAVSFLPPMRDWDKQTPLEVFLADYYKIVHVDKQAYIDTFSPHLKAKIEFARISVCGQSYDSFCIEAKNKLLVQTLSHLMVPDQKPISYLAFLGGLCL